MSRDKCHVSQEPIFRPCNVGRAEDSTWAVDTAFPADATKHARVRTEHPLASRFTDSTSVHTQTESMKKAGSETDQGIPRSGPKH